MEADKKRINQNYMMLQRIQEQINQIQENVQQVNGRVEEIREVIGNIKEISGLEKGSEILIPVSNGVFIKAKTLETTEYLVNVGAKTLVNKSSEQVVDLLNAQKEEMLNVQLSLTKDLMEAQEQGQRLQEELKKLIESAEKKA